MAKRKAIISVYDKSGVVEFARALIDLGFEILSTGGTAAELSKAGIPVTLVSEVTGFPEILGGRVKTLHPKIHAGILARATREHEEELKLHGIDPISLVAVNLYPFKETIEKPDVTLEEAVENIDIGGPTMVRAAAKNFERVTVVTDPGKYSEIIAELRSKGDVSKAMRAKLAEEAFRHTAEYDAAIAGYLGANPPKTDNAKSVAEPMHESQDSFVPIVCVRGTKAFDLRYGENPHQMGAFYAIGDPPYSGIAGARLLQGKPLSFNNLLDADAALRIMREFREEPVAVVIKHTNPCGVATGSSLEDAYVKAREADPVSAFGSIVGLGGILCRDTATRIVETFVEAVLAKGVTDEALDVLSKKPNLRVLVLPENVYDDLPELDVRWVDGGFIAQSPDVPRDLNMDDVEVVTERRPTEQEARWLLSAFKVVKHVKSNAIVFWKDDATVGVGAGQMNRVGSVRIAAEHAGIKAEGAVMASDAFFPFRDGVDAAAKAGVTAIIQPGGSIRDKESIDAANEHGIAMVFTGIRHFRH
ncbi:MAG TPA: bifunctional phosphoribosylaminoimidazolecarboxamide formyltransferase/IMP cyclohydrolase [Bacillota bacterium]|nr:bifunctional phosphoribosylaminoimidazolecarboxamide formyltransferase/IMP cyclohydrolase [Bacillota bacterium]